MLERATFADAVADPRFRRVNSPFPHNYLWIAPCTPGTFRESMMSEAVMHWRKRFDRHPRSFAPTEVSVIAIVVFTTAALTGALVYQAHVAYRSQSQQANQALTHYSSVAAWQFARASQQDLLGVASRTVGSPVHRQMRAIGGDPHRVSPADLRALPLDTTCDCRIEPLPVLAYFRYETRGRGLEIENGSALDSIRIGRLRRVLADASSAFGPSDPDCALLVEGSVAGDPWAVSLVAVADLRNGPVIFGAISTAAALAPVFASVAKRTSLLPAALLGQVQQQAMVSLRVTAGARVLYERDRGGWSLAAADSIGSLADQMTVSASLASAAAPQLLFGGLPRSRIPLIVALVAASVVLLIVAIAQLLRGARLAKTRSDFVASISHELRTPVALIRAHAETLDRERVLTRPDHRRFLDVVLRETNRLGRMVENVLQLSAIERGVLRLQGAPAALAPLVRAAVLDFAPLAQARDVTLVPLLADGLVATVDPAALTQMLFNILGNAVKYGPAGQRITITLERVGDSGRLLVDDEGPGVMPHQRVSAFQRYVRLVNVDAGGPAGGGIGLAIVRELAEAQGMSVWIDDAPGGGARIVVNIPIEQPGPEPKPDGIAELERAGV
jgi:signal transduction histidine kinase